MEILTGDRESEFPQQITPFPESVDQPPVLESANVPLQKLRPIRRSSAEDPPSFETAADKSLKFGSGSVAESLDPKAMWFDTEDESRYVILRVFFFFNNLGAEKKFFFF